MQFCNQFIINSFIFVDIIFSYTVKIVVKSRIARVHFTCCVISRVKMVYANPKYRPTSVPIHTPGQKYYKTLKYGEQSINIEKNCMSKFVI